MFIGYMAAAAALVAATPAAEWGQRLRTDATVFRDTVADSHPGPVNARDPGFTARLDAAYTRALRRARSTRSYPAYSWALDELTAAFDDGHLGIMADPEQDAAYPWAYRWTGFVTAPAGAGPAAPQVVTVSQEPGVGVGATLIGCDGVPATALAADRIGRFTGRWMLAAQRARQASTLFLPPDNPWLAPLRRCTFEQGGQRHTVTLRWRPIAADARAHLLAASRERLHAPVALTRLADGTAWIGLGSFDSDAGSADGKALDALAALIETQAADLRRAPRLVFDLRGNNGGSSAWLARMATSLWGKPLLDARMPDNAYVEWRVSAANIDQIRQYQTAAAARQAVDPVTWRWANRTLAGLTQAQAAGRPLWTEPHDLLPGALPARSPAQVLPNPVAARVFVLTDHGCASACLDAVDLLTAVGAVQVGQETGADTDYMDIRQRRLADGARLWVPMKVYRGRPRGSNVPAVPRHAWTGSIADTPALQRWIAAL